MGNIITHLSHCFTRSDATSPEVNISINCACFKSSAHDYTDDTENKDVE